MARATKKNKKKKSGLHSLPAMEAPPQFDPEMFKRDVLGEGRQGLQLMHEAYPQLLELQRKYGADFARSEVDIGEARGISEAAAVGRSGGLMRESILKTSPEIAAANQSMMDRLKELGPSQIEGELNKQALEDLRLKGSLSGEDIRSSQQAARAAMGARGMNSGRTAALSEVLNRQNFSDARKGERRQFASAIDAQVQQRKAGDAAISNNTFNTLGAFWDPQQRLFGRGGSQVSGQVSGPNAFAPYLGAAQDVGRSNQATSMGILGMNQAAYEFGINRADSNYWNQQNMMASDRNARSQRNSNLLGAGIGALGSIGGAAILASFL